MKFRFCGDADCVDWIQAEIGSLSKLSSIKLKSLTQIVIQGILKPPLDYSKVEKMFADSKLDSDIDLKACVACLSYILSSTIRYNCDTAALHSELQQLGLPREQSAAIKRVLDSQCDDLTEHFKKQCLTVNQVDSIKAEVDEESNSVLLKVEIAGKSENVTLLPSTAKALLEDLKSVKEKISQL